MEKYTFRHAIEHFLHYVGDASGFLSDDNGWSKRALAESIKQQRATIIKQYQNDPDMLTPEMYQPLQCIEMEEADQQLCPCAPSSGCSWYVSKDPIPKPLILESVTDTLGIQNYDYLNWKAAADIKTMRLPSARTSPYYTIREAGNGDIYLYAWGKKVPPLLTLNAIFEDPIEAAIFAQCGKDTTKLKCYPLDIPISLGMHLQDELFRRMVSTLVPVKSSAPEDDLNNDKVDRQRFTKLN